MSWSALAGAVSCTLRRTATRQFQAEYGFWLQFLAKYPPLGTPGFANLPPELCVSFSDWCVANNLTVVPLFFLPLVALYGYGYVKGDDASGNISLPVCRSMLTTAVDVRIVVC